MSFFISICTAGSSVLILCLVTVILSVMKMTRVRYVASAVGLALLALTCFYKWRLAAVAPLSRERITRNRLECRFIQRYRLSRTSGAVRTR